LNVSSKSLLKNSLFGGVFYFLFDFVH